MRAHTGTEVCFDALAINSRSSTSSIQILRVGSENRSGGKEEGIWLAMLLVINIVELI